MADERMNQSTTWPLPKFYFKVSFGDASEAAFQEVSGLNAEAQIVEYRDGNSPVFSAVKMPGIKKFSNVTLKKGVFAKDNPIWKWYEEIKSNHCERQTVTIQLCDGNGNPAMTWNLSNAWPAKITVTDLTSDGNEVTVETLELAHEGLTLANS